MKLETQVVSLELAKRLKELGVKQESLFWWDSQYRADVGFDLHEGKAEHFSLTKKPYYAAFTIAEIGELLNKHLITTEWDRNRKRCRVISDELVFEGDTEADARGAMLISLLETKIITP